MTTKIVYAIVNKSKLKFASKMVFVTLDERLPIFWVRKVADSYLEEKQLKDRYQVIKMYLPIDYP